MFIEFILEGHDQPKVMPIEKAGKIAKELDMPITYITWPEAGKIMDGKFYADTI